MNQCRIPGPANFFLGFAFQSETLAAMTVNEPGRAATPQLTVEDWFTPGRFAALLGVFLAATFAKVIFGQETFFFRDFGAFTYPVAQYFRDSFWRGELPLWNPLNDFGVPMLAQWNPAMLYPPSLFYLVFPLSWSLGVFNVAHLFLAGMGMYFLARRWTGNQLAAAVAGAAFAFNGLNWHMLMWISNLAACAWMPWVVLAVEQAWRRGGRWLAGAALAGAMQMLTGSPEIIMLTWLFVGALWAQEFVWGGLPRGWMTGRFAAVGLLVTGLAAAQLLPFLELAKHSQRDAAYSSTLGWAMPLSGLANFLAPLFHCYPAGQGLFVQYDQYWVASYYSGAGLLLLAAAGVWGARNRRVWLLAGAGILSVWMALGDKGHLYSWVKAALPALGMLRYPIKFVVLAVFTIPLLAAYGVSWQRSETGESTRALRVMRNIGVVLLLLLAAIVWVAWRHPMVEDDWPATWRNALSRAVFVVAAPGLLLALGRAPEFRLRAMLAVLLLLALWLDVYTHAPNLSPAMNRGIYAPGLIRADLKLDGPAEASRFMETKPVMDKVHYLSLKDPAADYLCRRLTLFDNCNLLDDISKADGFFSLYLRDSFHVTELLYAADDNSPDLKGLEDFLGISHLSATNIDATKILDWTARSSYLPLMTAGQAPVFAMQSNIWPALVSKNFDPRETVYLPPEAQPFITARRADAKIIFTDIQAQRLNAEVEAASPSLLVVAQSFYTPWHAYVDGARVKLWEANGAFQALEIPAGRHEVMLIYEDEMFEVGAVISLTTLAALVVFWIWRRRHEGQLAAQAA
jgi:hypothetical protein